MPVPLIVFLKFLSSERNSSGWPSSNIFMLMLYVSYAADYEFLRILTLMMWLACSSSNSKFTNRIGRGSIHACTSVLSHGPLFMV